ncbi:MAG: GNAT family N-acetyltransferase [Acidobacteria bacterium]|nr:GNAT family N-acetyltransferase [Acidobacteriota bacterium]MDA1235804.1 GNAT family N-acetyltransferase [Acidobacteriota bacterium]
MSAARATLDLALVDLRELRGADLRPLLVQQERRWRELFSWDFSASSQAILSFLNSRTLHGFALVRSGIPVGYCYFVLDQNKALVGDIFLSDRNPNPAAQRALLVRTLETAAAYPGVSRVEGQLLGLSGELAPESIFHRELTIFPRWFMIRDQLRAFRADRPELASHSFLPWGEHYLAPAADLIASAYRGHDDSQINDQYRDVLGARRFLANTTRHTGCGTFLPAASWVAIQPGSASISGICLATRVDEDAGHVTQLCVSPGERGMGVGRELLRRTLLSLRACACDTASLTVTDSNAGALSLYQQMGFRPTRRFSAFVWESGR